jgi:hypothetical protein
MYDFFSDDYQIRRIQANLKRAREETAKRTPEEKLKYLQSFGIVDENGNPNPGYEFLWRDDTNDNS